MKIRTDKLNKILLLIIFVLVNGTLFPQSGSQGLYGIGDEYKATEERINELVVEIRQKLSGTTVLELFNHEHKTWLEYKDSHLVVLFPEYINGFKTLWGTIQSYYLSMEIIKFNNARINVLLDYLDERNMYGTSGSRSQLFEIINELDM